jgi:hypothetical protein
MWGRFGGGGYSHHVYLVLVLSSKMPELEYAKNKICLFSSLEKNNS